MGEVSPFPWCRRLSTLERVWIRREGRLSANSFAGVPPFQAVSALKDQPFLFDGHGCLHMVLSVLRVPWRTLGGIGRDSAAGNVSLQFGWSVGFRAGVGGAFPGSVTSFEGEVAVVALFCTRGDDNFSE